MPDKPKSISDEEPKAIMPDIDESNMLLEVAESSLDISSRLRYNMGQVFTGMLEIEIIEDLLCETSQPPNYHNLVYIKSQALEQAKNIAGTLDPNEFPIPTDSLNTAGPVNLDDENFTDFILKTIKTIPRSGQSMNSVSMGLGM